jgi:F-type H+-transporting ATPase subunit epsilon
LLPGESGELGKIAGHSTFNNTYSPRFFEIEKPDGQTEFVFVAGGILEIQPHSVTVLADTAIRGADLDEAKANEAKRRAEDLMATRSSDIEFAYAQSELALAC